MTVAVNFRNVSLSMETVAEYHDSAFWAGRRAEYLLDHPDAACFCGRPGVVQLHHLDYRHLGEEPDDDLLPVCEHHHYEIEKHIRYSDLDRRAATIEYVQRWRARSERTVADGPHRLDPLAGLTKAISQRLSRRAA